MGTRNVQVELIHPATLAGRLFTPAFPQANPPCSHTIQSQTTLDRGKLTVIEADWKKTSWVDGSHALINPTSE